MELLSHRSSTWTIDRVATLKELVALKVPYPDIAGRLDTTVGSVCAKVHRLKIGRGYRRGNPKPTGGDYGGGERPPNRDYDVALQRLAAEARMLAGQTIAWRETGDHHCRFVVGEVGVDTQVCGQTRLPGNSYCETHAKRCQSTREVSPVEELVTRERSYSVAAPGAWTRLFGRDRHTSEALHAAEH